MDVPLNQLSYVVLLYRGLIVSHDDDFVEYLDVDTGKVEKVAPDHVFVPCGTLLAIPNAASR